MTAKLNFRMEAETLNAERRTLNAEQASPPCTLMLLSPTLSSFGEEREKAGAIFEVLGFNTRIVIRGNLSTALSPLPPSQRLWRTGRGGEGGESARHAGPDVR